MFDISSIQALFNGNAVKQRQHFRNRIKERNIKKIDVAQALLSGEIIEECPNDLPLPSILILGYTKANKPLHIAVGVDDDIIWLVTAYFPTLDKWEADYKTRKG
ncbi:MAG: DUF4258 domain-containing protein [Defluviitaleaceae bacterium]|nr:DUF4258 domain-containing protein [Defluviitaleaceae bacterium]MCL2262655.1 DUF4258 domain-containing protein [Defluviitaleaceae bacterium]